LLDQKVVSQAEYDQRLAQAEAARNQYAAMRNTMQQQYRLLEASRARASLAHKSLADTVVRSPFAGVVVERKISVGDFVTRGTKVVTVVKVAPLRLELTVPEQSVAAIAAGESVRLQVDAYPGRSFQGQVRFVSPSVRADQRSLMVEAVVPNRDGLLRPGMFVAAEISLPSSEPSLVVPSEAVETVGGISRVFVVHGDRVDEHMVTLGQVVGPTTEIVRGLNAGDMVAVSSPGGLSDGARVRVAGGTAGSPPQAPVSPRGNK
ncbi:MAG: efflux RND transporter periplasmic adaptor subunit, partial [Acidobacteriota bacterium]